MSGVRIPSGTLPAPELFAGWLFYLWWVWRSWLARQIVALEAEGSNPSIHPYNPCFKQQGFFSTIVGHRQAVRHRTLTPALVGSNPAGPVKKHLELLASRCFLIPKTLQKTSLVDILVDILSGISKTFVIMKLWYTNFILLHLADIWQNRKDLKDMARKVIERNISYDDIRKKYYVNLDYGIINGKRKKNTAVL